MKIDFVISAITAGGAERVMVLVANQLAELGHQVRLISLNEGEAYELSSKIERVKLHHGRIPVHRVRYFVNLMRFYRNSANRPEVLISFITLMNLVTLLAARFYNIPIIVSEHNSYLRFQKPKWLCDLKKH